MGVIIGVDIGGTQLRVASFAEGSTIPVKVHRIPTHVVNENVLDRLIAAIDFVWPQVPVDALSVACPGPLDPSLGIIHSTPNIPGWNKFPLMTKLENRFHIPVFLENDANLAALGEWSYGIGQGYDDLIYFTISTGIGGGVISGGHLLSGAHGMATELGHITVLSDGPLCSCGQQGHLEAISSGTGIAQYVKDRVCAGRISILTNEDTITARKVSQAAQQGDELCLEAFTFAGRYLGQAIADYLHIFNPSMLIFGGGVSQSHELLFPPMKKSLAERIMDPAYLNDLRLELAMLGDDAGLLGALAHARMKLS
jgi:glucokinase